MAFEIPIDEGELSFEIRLKMEGEFYGFDFHFNGRAQTWFVSLEDADGELVASNLAIRGNTPLNFHLRHLTGGPPGAITCIDTQGRGDDPGETDLGTRHKLIYLTSAELGEIGA